MRKTLVGLALLLVGCTEPMDRVNQLAPQIHAEQAAFMGFEYEIPPVVLGRSVFTVAYYSRSQELVVLDRYQLRCRFTCKIGKYELDSVLSHELAHSLADKFSKSKDEGPWPPYTESDEELIITSMLAEGTAEWIANFGKPSPGFERVSYGLTVESWIGRQPISVRYAGFQLVAPILEEHGLVGLEYLIGNPPATLGDLPTYTETALSQLP